MAKLKIKRSYFAFPYFFLSALFIIIPLVILLVYAFIDKATGSFTFANFGKFFASWDTWRIIGRSFLVALVVTAICLLLAYPIAMILSNSKINKSATLVLLFVLPMWINSILRTYAINEVFKWMGTGAISPFFRVVIAMVYDFFPFMLLPLYTIMVNMDKSYIEASEDLGGSPLKTFLKVKLPLTLPGIISGILMVFMPTVSTFAIPEIVADSTMYLLGNSINTSFEKGMYNVGSAFAFILLVIIAGTMVIANWLSGGKAQPSQTRGGGGGVV